MAIAWNGSQALTAGQSHQVVFDTDDDTGNPLAAGAIAYTADNAKLTLNAAHTLLAADQADGYYQVRFTASLAAGGSGADFSVLDPLGERRYFSWPASHSNVVNGRMIYPFSGGTMGLSVACIAGGVTLSYANIYATRLSD